MAKKPGKYIFGMTIPQFSILAGILGAWLLATIAFFGYTAYTFLKPPGTAQPSLAQATVLSTPLPSPSSDAPFINPTRTPIPKPTRRATLTPLPSPTRYPTLPPPITTSSAPGNVQPTTAPQYPPQSPPQNICNDPTVVYNKRVHQINLRYLDEYYGTYINYYQRVLDQALRERDALTFARTQRTLEEYKAQYAQAVKDENASYRASVPAGCR